MQLGKVSYAITCFLPRSALGVWFYSTTRPQPPPRVLKNPWRELYRRISPVGDPNVSIVPILNQWIDEKRPVHKDALVDIIKTLRRYKRFTHALEISTWMTDVRYIIMTPADVAIRLDLMSKIHGIEQVENYFNNVPQQLKGYRVYGALLNCYAHATSIEKAEALLQKMKDLGFHISTLTYNGMLGLYYRTGNMERLETLRREMDVIGIKYDKYTYTILLSAYAAVSDIETLEKTLMTMEADILDLDWVTYAAIATAYRNAGILDKALEVLKKSEKLIIKSERKHAYYNLITLYATIGSKDEAQRIWELLKKEGVVYNTGYKSFLTVLLKLDDIESAEMIFDEWESQCVNLDVSIPNYLICHYCRKGPLEKAESLVNKLTSRGMELNAHTWYYLAEGYLQNDQTLKAVETMKQAVELSCPRCELNPDKLAAFLEHFKGDDSEKVKELINLSIHKKIVCWASEREFAICTHRKMEAENERQPNAAVIDDDDDPPTLSSHAFAALKEFLEQQNQTTTEETGGESVQKVALVSEDWRLSQFWYEPLTAETLANEVISLLTSNPGSRAACIACPTLFAFIKEIDPNVSVQLLEYDRRFEQYGSDFTFYDYKQPEELPTEFKQAFRVVIADPPYLSKECLEKVAQTISFLATPEESYLLLLTGEVQKDKAAELLGLRPCGFRPQHTSKLGNEFRLFTNYDPGNRLGGWEQ